jgi:NAD(P)-dependent dehydrogenase (short-subunit alcohol dehydrogenase family)
MARGDASGVDALALRGEVERALGALEDVRRIKVQLTNAAGGIEEARRVLDGMAERVRGHLGAIDSLVASAGVDDDA